MIPIHDDIPIVYIHVYYNMYCFDNRSILMVKQRVHSWLVRSSSALLVMSHMPTNITIAHGDNVGCRVFINEAARHGCPGESDTWCKMHVPYRKPLDQPTIHQSGGDWRQPATIRAVFEQEWIIDIVSRIVNVCNGYDPANTRNGESGYKWIITSEPLDHLAGVVSNVVVSYLNNIHDDDGRRVFNAQGFEFNGNTGRKTAVEASNDCLRWAADDPHSIIESTGGEQSHIFGYTAAIVSPTGASNFGLLYEMIGRDYQLWQAVVDHAAASSHADAPPIRSSHKRARYPAMVPQSPRLPPRDRDHARDAPWHAWYDEPTDHHTVTGDATDHTWATTDPNIKVWWGVLVEAGVDDMAIQSLFCLAQLSTDGYRNANNIVNTMLKKTANDHGCRNPSGFVHAAVQTARHKLMPKDW